MTKSIQQKSRERKQRRRNKHIEFKEGMAEVRANGKGEKYVPSIKPTRANQGADDVTR